MRFGSLLRFALLSLLLVACGSTQSADVVSMDTAMSDGSTDAPSDTASMDADGAALDSSIDVRDATPDAADVALDATDVALDRPDVPSDAGPNPCVAASGMCITAVRSSGGVPGFSVMCPSGTALYDGMMSRLGPGTDYLTGPLNGGCGTTSNDGGEATLYACCYARVPGDGGADVESDAPSDGGAAASCVASGGSVGMGLCCLSTGDFPSSCLTGACGCSPTSSHMVRTCNCAAGMCFDGTRCRAP